jgi:hypothetical protein
MDGSQIPKIAFEYNPKCTRDVGCSRKRWMGFVKLEQAKGLPLERKMMIA